MDYTLEGVEQLGLVFVVHSNADRYFWVTFSNPAARPNLSKQARIFDLPHLS